VRQVLGIVLLLNAVAVIGAALTGNLPNWPPTQADIHVVDDQFAAVTRVLKRIFSKIPDSRAVSSTYRRICSPPTIAWSSDHGRKGKPSVYMSESERTPG